jgi:hypothetical protein
VARAARAWIVAALWAGASAQAQDVLYQTARNASQGQAYGYALNANQYLGVRFENAEPWLVTAVGGHLFQNEGIGPGLFAAIVDLQGPDDLPRDSQLSDAIWSTTFQAPLYSQDVEIPSGVLLYPGWHALVFGGGGLFGSTGGGGVAAYDVTIGDPKWLRWQQGVWEASNVPDKRFFLLGLVQCIEDTGDAELDCDEECFDGYDNDADGWTDCQDTDCWFYVECCDADGDGFDRADEVCGFGPDCNDFPDAGPSFRPDAAEGIADGIDQNCDGVDLCWVDEDLDGYGSYLAAPGAGVLCEGTPGVSAMAGDCRDVGDRAAWVRPGVAELPADGVDQNCDGRELCFADEDGDGYGLGARVEVVGGSCFGVPGASATGDDCSDTDPLRSPSAVEIPADGVDQNCDGLELCFLDEDGDGYGVPSLRYTPSLTCEDVYTSARSDDCDDRREGAFVHPDAVDAPGDGLDQDCDGVDACFLDEDLDGFGSATLAAFGASDCTRAPGLAATSEDCDDVDPSRYPGAAEVVADGVDQSCDGGDRCYFDRDRDGHGGGVSGEAGGLNCADVPGFSPLSDDCADVGTGAATRFPGAAERLADGVDQDCDGVDACPRDGDGDGHGGPEVVPGVSLQCGEGPGEAVDAADCDDADPTIGPSAPEVAQDGVDQDCDGADACFGDADGDGFGVASPAPPDEAGGCAGPGRASQGGDCDDADASVAPGASEVPWNGRDDDCTGGDARDVDGDGVEARQVGGGDCDDLDAAIGPGRTERADGRDQDCDGLVDEGTDDFDDDRDGITERGGDCDDTRAAVSPARTERADGVDEDCDGLVDEGTVAFDDDGDGYAEAQGDCADGDPAVHPGRPEVPDNGVDDDCDGMLLDLGVDPDRDGVTAEGGDCAPTDPRVGPRAAEVDDGRDNDCDGVVDEGTRRFDDDGDGLTEVEGDCHDGAASVHPGAPDGANGMDDDCDGRLDEDGVITDVDGDGSAPPADCNDRDAGVRPGAVERQDGVDQNCDGVVDEGLDDADADGDGFSRTDGDCDDRDGWVSPARVEVCDGVDNDCDGAVDAGCGPQVQVPLAGCAQGRWASVWSLPFVAISLRRRKSGGITRSLGVRWSGGGAACDRAS